MTSDRGRQPVSGYNISHGGLECEPVMSFIIFLSNALSTSKSFSEYEGHTIELNRLPFTNHASLSVRPIFYLRILRNYIFFRLLLNRLICKFHESNIGHNDFCLSVRPLSVTLMVPPLDSKRG